MPKSIFNRIILLTAGLTAIWALLSLRFFEPVLHQKISFEDWFFLFWFPVITLVSLKILQHTLLQNQPKAFVRMFMVSMMLRMFLSLVILIVLVYTGEKTAVKPHIYFFAALYFSYFVFDVMAVMALLKNTPKS